MYAYLFVNSVANSLVSLLLWDILVESMDWIFTYKCDLVVTHERRIETLIKDDIVTCNSSTGCPKKYGNSVTNLISSLLWISIVMPNFKTHNIIMSARVYFM